MTGVTRGKTQRNTSRAVSQGDDEKLDARPVDLPTLGNFLCGCGGMRARTALAAADADGHQHAALYGGDKRVHCHVDVARVLCGKKLWRAASYHYSGQYHLDFRIMCQIKTGRCLPEARGSRRRCSAYVHIKYSNHAFMEPSQSHWPASCC